MTKLDAFARLEKITYLTPASPVVLVATRDKNGVPNIAPIGYFATVSSRPPKIIVGISPKARTEKNIRATGEFVVAIPAPEMLQKTYNAVMKAADGEDKIAKVGLTAYDGLRIQEAAANLVCKVDWMKETGDHTVICADVVAADVEERLFDADIAKLRRNLSHVHHITDNKFLVDGAVVEVEKTER
jgi:flavin reductase (DIM6/NTAB) family NADH-FMN oxidoreductase RutF